MKNAEPSIDRSLETAALDGAVAAMAADPAFAPLLSQLSGALAERIRETLAAASTPGANINLAIAFADEVRRAFARVMLIAINKTTARIAAEAPTPTAGGENACLHCHIEAAILNFAGHKCPNSALNALARCVAEIVDGARERGEDAVALSVFQSRLHRWLEEFAPERVVN